MLDRMQAGELPDAPHTALRGPSGALRYEHCITRDAFDGAYTISHHVRPPHAIGVPLPPVPCAREPADDTRLVKRHFRSSSVHAQGDPVTARVPLLFNADVSVSIASPTTQHETYALNGDADELLFVIAGSGTLHSAFGALPFTRGDYVCIPKGVLHRYTCSERARLLVLELVSLAVPARFRNGVGQLRMDAPYGHRDFVRPTFVGPFDEGIRTLVVKRHGALHRYPLVASPFDAVGFDGSVYPWVFPIDRFRPRVGKTHLPPDVHTTFAARGVVVSSFVPRPLDFHASAVPCPYPHSSVDCDEVIFYQDGDFLSRRGIEAGSITLHPAGIPHGPAPGAYEASIGRTHVEEHAVMLDTDRPLVVTRDAARIEDERYHARALEEAP